MLRWRLGYVDWIASVAVASGSKRLQKIVLGGGSIGGEDVASSGGRVSSVGRCVLPGPGFEGVEDE